MRPQTLQVMVQVACHGERPRPPAQQADHKRKTDGYVVTAQEKNLAERGGKHRYNWSAKTKEKNSKILNTIQKHCIRRYCHT